jgi:putative spermidine/putrescine transport system permease protein
MTKRFDLPTVLLCSITLIVLGFILTPIWITIAVSFNKGNYIVFPPEGFSFRWYIEFFQDYTWLMVFKNSMIVALPTMVLSTIVGVMCALGYMRRKFPGRHLINLAVMMPFLVPGILIGICLLIFLHKVNLTGTYTAVVIGHSLWGIPTVFLLVQAVLAGYDFSIEDAARDLGAGPIRAFFSITLPCIRTGIFTAMIFSFITSFGEFNIALFLTAPQTMTMPVQIWNSLKYEVTPIVAAVSTVMILVTLVGVGIGAKFIGVQKMTEL